MRVVHEQYLGISYTVSYEYMRVQILSRSLSRNFTVFIIIANSLITE